MNYATVTLPKKVFEDIVRATEHFGRAQDEMEDYFLSQNKQFIARMKKLRKEHKRGKIGNWTKIVASYGL